MSFFKKKQWWGVIILISLSGYWWYAKRNIPSDLFTTVKVERGDIEQIVSASVVLLADQEIDLNFETLGRIKNVSVKAGAQVSQGDTLVSMESSTLSEELQKAQASLDKALADAGVNDDTLREARNAQKDAKQYADDVADAENQKVDAADKAYDNAMAYESDVQKYYDQVKKENGMDSVATKSARLTLTSAENARKAAQEAADTARQNRDVSNRVANNAYEAQKEKVKLLESESKRTIENSAIAIARANYAIALNNLDKATVKAPLNGTITQLNYQKGEVIGSAASKPFGRLLSSDLILEAKIPESDIAAIKAGQAATVSFDAFNADDTFEATVISIDPESTVIQDVVYYKIKLRLVSIDTRFKPGMSGDVDILIEKKKNTLLLPNRAVKQDGKVRYVEIKNLDGQSTQRRDVKVGLEGNEGQVEVLSGVVQDDEVVTETKKK